ncbi:hypothetical protein WR25_07559 [Diploscapter pachys]|uniref:Uncharacterized protein n=1 Tax=Diploscapter pachys TaxID=2018661 RepID=A0A2A2KFV4_9BILA|nr:hypothetical protein WR25_07559 [Diploscapter pachys]
MVGSSQRPGAGCSSGVANTTAWRSLANRLSTAAQFGAVSSTTLPPIVVACPWPPSRRNLTCILRESSRCGKSDSRPASQRQTVAH